MPNRSVSSLVLLAALDAIPDPDRELVDRHLATCSSCRRRMDDVHQIMAELTPDAADPGPELLERILHNATIGR